MGKLFIVLGWLVLLFVLIYNQTIHVMSTPMIILLCIISAIILSVGVLISDKKK